jgi:DNA replication protein DnaC
MAKSAADVFSEFREAGLLRRHRYERACDGDPALRRVRRALRGTGAAKLEAVLAGGDGAEFDAELDRLAAQEEAALRGLAAGPRYNCEDCRDTGIVDGAYCNCLRDMIYRECYGAVRIDRLEASFAGFDAALFDDTDTLPGGRTQRRRMELYRQRALEYTRRYPDNKYKNILLTGKTGLGKTYLLSCMAKEAKKRGVDTLMIRAGELFRVFLEHRLGEEVDLSYLHGAGLLLVDDVGTEPVTQNVSVEYFYDLVSRRLEQGLHSVYATNADNLQRRYDDRIASRLQSKEDCMRFYFEGRDLRD